VDLSTNVLRPAILRIAGHRRFQQLVTSTRPGRAVSTRFVAGETLQAALAVAFELRGRGVKTMLDYLGENVRTPAKFGEARDAYLAALSRIGAEPSLDAAIGVKLTQLGLDVSPEECWEHLVPILDAATARGKLVMIDMESHAYVDRTIATLRRAYERSTLVGIAIQSYLKRSATDVFELPEGVRVRLVKGAYLEPPGVVLKKKREVDASYSQLFATLLSRGHPIDVATHDPDILEGVRARVDSVPGGWSRVEFQMLYGVRRDLQDRLAGQGYPVRVYIPYGTEWYPYLTRRLAERPANLWFFLSNLVRVR
jgi:proline dehydrogenase